MQVPEMTALAARLECENGSVRNEYDGASAAPLAPTIDGVRIDWMVFDLGNVVLYQTDAFPELARRIGAAPTVSADEFRSAYNAPRRGYDLDSDQGKYWGLVASASGAPPPDARTIADLTDADLAMWSRTDPAIIAMFSALREAGIRLAVLSNAPTAMRGHVRRQQWAHLFEKVVISGEINLLKPDAAIYRYLLRELATPANRVAFADDLAENIDGANAAGIRGILFRGPTALRADLVNLGVPFES
ncbi:MAG: HAD family phosphatase [Nakamurella sp.]